MRLQAPYGCPGEIEAEGERAKHLLAHGFAEKKAEPPEKPKKKRKKD